MLRESTVLFTYRREGWWVVAYFFFHSVSSREKAYTREPSPQKQNDIADTVYRSNHNKSLATPGEPSDTRKTNGLGKHPKNDTYPTPISKIIHGQKGIHQNSTQRRRAKSKRVITLMPTSHPPVWIYISDLEGGGGGGVI